jgi:Histidine kinase-, DNA gyrase B-, and HSP90-like ATPase
MCRMDFCTKKVLIMQSNHTVPSKTTKPKIPLDSRIEYDSMRDMNLFDLKEEFVKTIIRSTIETYSGPWRLVHEAIQNAHDHIQLNDNITEGLIEIHLFVGSNVVRIKDNGTGIAISKFNNIFLIGGSDKTNEAFRKILKGSQGVGIKSTLFTSSLFKVETVFDGYTWNYEVNDCHKFQESGFQRDITPPETEPSSLSSGSVFTYSLANYTVQDFINEMVQEYCAETKADSNMNVDSIEELKTVIETYFRTRTYLGCVQTLLGVNDKLKPIDVKVILDFDSQIPEDYRTIDLEYCHFFQNNQPYGRQITHSFPAKYLDVLDIHANIKRGEKVDNIYEDFQEVLRNPPDPATKKLLIQKFDRTSIKAVLSRRKVNRQTGQMVFEIDQARLRQNRSALEIVNGMYLVIGPKSYLLKYFHVGAKQNISVNGLPTNITLKLPQSALAYLNNIHLVLDVNCTLGFGKRNLHGRTKGSIDAFYREVWNTLRTVVSHIVSQEDAPDRDSMPKWEEVNELESYKNAGNTFRKSSLFFRTVPQEEQEVVALFFELIGSKTLKGYFPFRVGAQTIYDALFYIDKQQGNTIPHNIRARDLKFVEFKYRLSSLLTDLDNQTKFLDDIALLVCWINDIKEDASTGYSIHDLSRDEIDAYPGAQLRIKRGRDSCQVLILKDYLESSNII